MGYTSSAVKRRYNDKVYTQIKIALKKDLAADFKAAVTDRGDTQTDVIRRAILRYLDRPDPENTP